MTHELKTRSVLDLVNDIFSEAGFKTYPTRIFYSGAHSASKNEVVDIFRKHIEIVNSQYCDIEIKGLLIVYNDYFIHIVEGSENTIQRFFKFIHGAAAKIDEQKLLEWQKLKELSAQADEGSPKRPAETNLSAQERDKAPPKLFSRLKVFMTYYSVKEHYFDKWYSLMADPLTLQFKFDPYADISEHMEHLKTCLKKLEKLIILVKDDSELLFAGTKGGSPPRLEALPEYALLDFLLSSIHILDLTTLIEQYRRVYDYTYYYESVWPVPTHFTPRLLYKLRTDDTFVDPLPMQPSGNAGAGADGEPQARAGVGNAVPPSDANRDSD